MLSRKRENSTRGNTILMEREAHGKLSYRNGSNRKSSVVVDADGRNFL